MRTTVSRYLPAGKLACLGIFWLSENAIVMALDTARKPGRPRRLAQRFDPAHGEERRQRYYLFRLSAPSGPTHNRYKNEDGLQCRRSLAAWVEGQRCPKKFTTYPRSGPSAHGSTRPNTARCMRARSATRTASGPN